MNQIHTIRPATEADAPQIARLLIETWRSTFRDVLPDVFLSALSPEDQEARHRRRMRQPENRHLIAEDGRGQAVGFANAGRNRIAECPAALELYALYIADAHQGLGLGRRLIAPIAAEARARGRVSMAVEALSVNPHRGFYEHLGARRIGTRVLSLGELTVPTALYQWDDLRPLYQPLPAVASPVEAGRRWA
jgi:GNAT superfamily N-acetyltransferase